MQTPTKDAVPDAANEIPLPYVANSGWHAATDAMMREYSATCADCGIDTTSDVFQAYGARVNTQIRVYDLREDPRLFEKKFIKKIGVSTSDVRRAEQAEFDGLTGEVSQRDGVALDRTILVTYLPGCSAAKIAVSADTVAE